MSMKNEWQTNNSYAQARCIAATSPAMEAVLSDEYTRKVTFGKAWACHILDRKNTSAVIREFSLHFPLPQWLHLKRVKNNKSTGDAPLTVIVCPFDECHSEEPPTLRSLCPALSLAPDALGPLFVARVPVSAPLTRQQFEEGSLQWPTTFHEDKKIRRLLSGDILDNEDYADVNKYMNTACEAGENALSSKVLSTCAKGCAIVDPAKNCLLATGSSLLDHHPLHHAVMVTIDLIARQQGGGVYQYPDCVYINLDEAGSGAEDKLGPYLCTGYDLYADVEPCAMCAMALVHSRIRRVYYCKPSPDGALGSKYKIHVEAGLNHHFEVFRNLCPPDYVNTGPANI